MVTSDGTVLYLSKDVAFPYYNVTIDGVTQTVLNGEKIEEPATEPTKESTTEYDYIFDGWYNGDEKWDFENDTVNENLELVAKFTEIKKSNTADNESLATSFGCAGAINVGMTAVALLGVAAFGVIFKKKKEN